MGDSIIRSFCILETSHTWFPLSYMIRDIYWDRDRELLPFIVQFSLNIEILVFLQVLMSVVPVLCRAVLLYSSVMRKFDVLSYFSRG